MCYGSHIESEHAEVILQLAQCPFAACVKHVRRKGIPSFSKKTVSFALTKTHIYNLHFVVCVFYGGISNPKNIEEVFQENHCKI